MASGCTVAPSNRPAFTWNCLLATGFLVLSALDLLFTWQLIGTPGTCFFEANPVAGYVLAWAGWWGLGLYKLLCAVTVLGVSALLVARRPWLARGLLAVACPILCLVVGYSACLARSPERRQLLAAHQQAGELNQECRERVEYQELLSRVAHEVLRRQRTLVGAAGEIQTRLAAMRYNPLRALQVYYPTLSDEACLAAAVVHQATYLRQEHLDKGMTSVATLRAEFASAYARPYPTMYGDPYINFAPAKLYSPQGPH